jgi:oligoendopeptidase F
VNQSGQGVVGKYGRTDTYRKIMVEGSQFIKQNQAQIKEAVILTKGLIKQKVFSQILGKSVSYYLNMDGSQNTENQKVQNPKKEKSDFVSHVNRTNALAWGAVLLLIGGTIWAFYKGKEK